MARLRGRAKRGERCRAPVPHGHWKATTFTAGLRLTGMTAPMVLDGAMNVPAHKSAGVRTVIEAAGASLRHLPPYSPDFNPIEQAFSKLKAILRKAAARTIPDLWAAIGEAIPQFKPRECANYFEAAGYEPV